MVFPHRCMLIKQTLRILRTNQTSQYRYMSIKLIELGDGQPIKLHGTYDTGQMFIHRMLGYRGIVLFPWTCRVHNKSVGDRPLFSEEESLRLERSDNEETPKEKAEEAHRTRYYYQVLIDARDAEKARVQQDHVIYLLPDKQNMRYSSIHGVDYVPHEDITMPYRPAAGQYIDHPLFKDFFIYEESTGTYIGNQDLYNWKETFSGILKPKDVYVQTTEDIRITVMPFYLGHDRKRPESDDQGEMHHWRYTIRMENLGREPVQLRERAWSVLFSGVEQLQSLRGRGVVGKEPVLDVNQPAFQYTSRVGGRSSGAMWGSFIFERGNEDIEVRIPSFRLNVNNL